MIGTSTNVAVSGYLSRVQIQPITLFEIAPMGMILVAVGAAYMLLLGKRLLPNRKELHLVDDTTIRDYLTEIIILPGSHLIG